MSISSLYEDADYSIFKLNHAVNGGAVYID
jgi:hypothetical protein